MKQLPKTRLFVWCDDVFSLPITEPAICRFRLPTKHIHTHFTSNTHIQNTFQSFCLPALWFPIPARLFETFVRKNVYRKNPFARILIHSSTHSSSLDDDKKSHTHTHMRVKNYIYNILLWVHNKSTIVCFIHTSSNNTFHAETL